MRQLGLLLKVALKARNWQLGAIAFGNMAGRRSGVLLMEQRRRRGCRRRTRHGMRKGGSDGRGGRRRSAGVGMAMIELTTVFLAPLLDVT